MPPGTAISSSQATAPAAQNRCGRLGARTQTARRGVERVAPAADGQLAVAKAGQDVPFFVYFNHSLMHMPVIPREEFKGKTGHGDWADSLLELDTDFGALLDLLDELDLAGNTELQAGLRRPAVLDRSGRQALLAPDHQPGR